MKTNVRCAYVKDCYLGEAQECFGFKTDCPLYMKSNGEPCNEARFHAAMDRLIVRTKTRHDMIESNRQARQQPGGTTSKPHSSS